MNDAAQDLEKLLREELALDRSLGFTGSFVTVANVLGHHPKNRISSWSVDNAREYFPNRKQPWDADDTRSTDPPNSDESITPGVDCPPKELLEYSRVKQSEIRTVSLIRESLREKAGWVGTAFAVEEDESQPPIMGLIFRDGEAAKHIFSLLCAEIGTDDSEHRLRVAVVRGINRAKPHWYRIVIGSNPAPELVKQKTRYVVSVSRINMMQPDSGTNLERFLQSYQKARTFVLTPVVTRGESHPPEFINCPHLVKRELSVKQAWEVGRHDLDSAAISVDDAPIFPSDQTSPPVVELLRWKRTSRPSFD